jgi:hypothetical protein
MIICSYGTHRKYIGDQAMGDARGIDQQKNRKERGGKTRGCSPATTGDEHGIELDEYVVLSAGGRADMESWTTVVDGLLQRWIYSNVRALDRKTSWWCCSWW